MEQRGTHMGLLEESFQVFFYLRRLSARFFRRGAQKLVQFRSNVICFIGQVSVDVFDGLVGDDLVGPSQRAEHGQHE